MIATSLPVAGDDTSDGIGGAALAVVPASSADGPLKITPTRLKEVVSKLRAADKAKKSAYRLLVRLIQGKDGDVAVALGTAAFELNADSLELTANEIEEIARELDKL